MHPRTAVRAVTGAVAALALALSAAPAHAASFFGTNANPLFVLPSYTPDQWEQWLGAQASDGLTLTRSEASWTFAEPNAPGMSGHTYAWTNSDPRRSMDAMALAMARKGVRWIPSVGNPPAWAGGSGTTLAPSHFQDFADFTGAIAKRYGPGGTFWALHPEVAPVPVQQIEVWSEANSNRFWTGSPNASQYAQVLAAAAARIRLTPGVQVLASIGWPDAAGYMRQLYAQGAKGSIDAIGFHPYAPDAPSVLNLVASLRNVLREVGDGGIPIDITETGQPVVYSGTGASSAAEGRVTDAARAAKQALIGEALGRSDCGVGSYLLYALVGSETDREPLDEGYMGIYHADRPEPNITGAAIRDAGRRLEGGNRNIIYCGSGDTPRNDKLPLQISLTSVEPTCTTAHLTYHDLPLESAKLNLIGPDGTVTSSFTNAFGNTRACFSDETRITYYDVFAEVDKVAETAHFRCVIGAECTATLGTPGDTSFVAPQPALPAKTPVKTPVATAKSCWQLTGRITSITRRRTKLRARLTCLGGKTPAKAKVLVLLSRKGRGRVYLRPVTLRKGRVQDFSIRVRLRSTDKVLILREGTKLVPRLQITALRCAPGSKKSAGCPRARRS